MAPPPETRDSFRDRLAIWALFILSGQGVVNFLLRGTGLEWWKQALITLLFALAFKRSVRTPTLFRMLVIGCAISAVLVVMSVVSGVPTQLAFYSVFFYCAWLPFYIFGATARPSKKSMELLRALSFWVLVLTAIGITIQLLTPYLNFLIDDFELESVQYRTDAGEAQRRGFIYVASTLVMPTCLGFFTLLCMTGAKYGRRSLSLLSLGVSAVPTGSVASVAVLAGSAVIALCKRGFGGRLMLISFAFTAVLVFISAYAVIPQVAAQFDRILDNTGQNESNEGRLAVWQYSLDQISRATFIQHVVGRGLGASIDVALGGNQLNGESSFFQAYLEGGILGLLLRLWPFWLLFSNVKFGREAFWYGLTLFAICAIAPLFQAYGLQCILGFIAGLDREPTRTER